jgi:tetratricopeptide (TPR) repeat protein
MNRLKITLLFALLLGGNVLFAQTINEGKQFYNYERYNSALTVFNSIVSADPNNAEAVYWLGQTMIATNNVAGAKALYQKTLMANPNSPLLIAAMGHIELLDGKPNDARQRFETAISLSKWKDANTLIAIGKANIEAKGGDVVYAIDKLKQGAEINKKSAELLITLGDAYRKMNDGSNAQVAYQDAINLDPKSARALYGIGRIYETQGPFQESIFTKYYMDAIAIDPNFAPIFERLSNFYYTRDINKAKEYLDRYVATSDATSRKCYMQAAYMYSSGNNQGAISKANECVSSFGNNVYPKVYGILGYAYNKMGDSVNAKKYFEMYFQKQVPEELGPNDYSSYAKVLLKFPGNEGTVNNLIDKAIASDSVMTNKIDYATAMANAYLSMKDYGKAGYWFTKVLSIKTNFGKTDLFNAGYNDYRADHYQSADSVFKIYMNKYPDDILGYNMDARALAYIDSTGSQGLAKSDYDKVIELAEASTDTTTKKDYLIPAYRYMVAYYYVNKKDIPTAISYTEKILALDPTDTRAMENKKKLEQALQDQKKKAQQRK